MWARGTGEPESRLSAKGEMRLKPRVTILGIMAVVALVATALVALRGTLEVWASAYFAGLLNRPGEEQSIRSGGTCVQETATSSANATVGSQTNAVKSEHEPWEATTETLKT